MELVSLLRGCLKSRDFTNRSSMRLNGIGSITRDVWTRPSLSLHLWGLFKHPLTDPPSGWPGESGRVTAEVLGRLIPRDRNTRQYYVCGPDPMMDSVEAALTRLGVSLANIESERYNFI